MLFLLIAFLSPAAQAADCPSSRPVRLATVRNVQDAGLLAVLIRNFQRESGCGVDVYIGKQVYEQVRMGKADIVLSHFGHEGSYGLKQCVDAGVCEWPMPVLFSADAILIPLEDPAHVRGVEDPVEAFRRISKTRSTFVVNGEPGFEYVTTVLWNAAGRPNRAGWYVEAGVSNEAAAALAAKRHAYTIWGATAFLRSQRTQHWPLDAVVFNDQLFERLMVCAIAKSPTSNKVAAATFALFLLSPSTQATIRTFRSPGVDGPTFFPAGRNNLGSLLRLPLTP